MDLILASTSAYRRALLDRLLIPFKCQAPAVDETPRDGESPEAISLRLAMEKANAVAATNPGAVVLGSDQVACIDGKPLGKPGYHAAAADQLRASSGKSVIFHTAVALVKGDKRYSQVVTTKTRFRTLTDDQIEAYLDKETPYDCAGSFKCEGLGIALFEGIDTTDPTALEGLPLIATCSLLRGVGICVLA